MTPQDDRPARGPVTLDQRRLPEEWAAHTEDFSTASRLAADAKSDVATCKADLDMLAATLRLAVRRDPEKYGLGSKPTVDAVADAVTCQESYQAAVDSLNHANHTYDIAKADVDAMREKKSAMENLTKLWLADLYAPPSLAGVPQDQIDRARDELKLYPGATPPDARLDQDALDELMGEES